MMCLLSPIVVRAVVLLAVPCILMITGSSVCYQLARLFPRANAMGPLPRRAATKTDVAGRRGASLGMPREEASPPPPAGTAPPRAPAGLGKGCLGAGLPGRAMRASRRRAPASERRHQKAIQRRREAPREGRRGDLGSANEGRPTKDCTGIIYSYYGTLILLVDY